MKIDFVSDVSCPWCVIGLLGLEQGIAQVRQDIPDLAIKLHFQPFELNPQMAPEGEEINDHLMRKYGKSASEFEQTREAIRERGAALGFTFTKGARGHIYNTFDSHRLLHWAGLQGGEFQHDLKLALFKAYFTDGQNPGSHQVLAAAAAAVGLDAGAAAEVLASGAYAAEVRKAQALWQSHGIHAVPAVIINDRHLIEGGQPPEMFARALRQIAAEAARA